MSAEENKAITKRWAKIWDEGDVEALSEIIHPSYARHGQAGSNPWETTPISLDEFKTEMEKRMQEHPTWKVELEDTIAEGDKVALRQTWYVEGKPYANAVVIYRFSEGKIIDDWFCFKELDK